MFCGGESRAWPCCCESRELLCCWDCCCESSVLLCCWEKRNCAAARVPPFDRLLLFDTLLLCEIGALLCCWENCAPPPCGRYPCKAFCGR